MKLENDLEISDKLTSDYLERLRNRVFSLLYKFESIVTDEDRDLFKSEQRILIQTIKGHTQFIQYEDMRVIDVMSHLEALIFVETHDDYKKHIFKICNLLNQLKEVVESGL